jgi:endo-1,4-beta-xylanase
LPDWVTSPATPWTNKTLSKVLKNHVTKLVEHFGDHCYSWDVVNEAFADSPAGAYQSNIWFNTIGAEYVPMAFAAAQAVVEKNGLNVKLYYNDYNIESPGAKATAAQNLVTQLKGRGIQIDGVGLESHFIAGTLLKVLKDIIQNCVS